MALTFFSPALTTLPSAAMSNFATPLEAIQGIILAPTEPFDLDSTTVVRGPDFANGVDYDALFQSFKTIGFQATNFGLAVDEINAMVRANRGARNWEFLGPLDSCFLGLNCDGTLTFAWNPCSLCLNIDQLETLGHCPHCQRV